MLINHQWYLILIHYLSLRDMGLVRPTQIIAIILLLIIIIITIIIYFNNYNYNFCYYDFVTYVIPLKK
jgi:hypothetical protein